MNKCIAEFEMPESCSECPCCGIYYNIERYCQMANEEVLDKYENYHCRPYWCPLKEIKSE